MRNPTLLGCVVVALMTALLQSQTRPTFDAASIKVGNVNDIRSGIHIQPGGRFNTENTTVKAIIGFAYERKNYEIVGGPSWADSVRFTIEARASGIQPGTRNDTMQTRLMIQSLLAERFSLVMHEESRQQPVYELVTSRTGHKMRPADPAETDSQLTVQPGHLIGKNVPVSQLATSLSLQFGRAVIDKTGLAGRYHFDLVYTPEARDGLFGELLPQEPAPAANPDRPAIFTALQEQLGLRLESTRGLVNVVVIDSIQMPSAN